MVDILVQLVLLSVIHRKGGKHKIRIKDLNTLRKPTKIQEVKKKADVKRIQLKSHAKRV